MHAQAVQCGTVCLCINGGHREGCMYICVPFACETGPLVDSGYLTASVMVEYGYRSVL